MTIFRVSVALGTGDPDEALRAAAETDLGWLSAGPHVPAALAQIRVGAQAFELRPPPGIGGSGHARVVRSEDMLDFYGVTEETWREATARVPHFTDTDGTQPDCWRYLIEVQDIGLPANDHGYR